MERAPCGEPAKARCRERGEWTPPVIGESDPSLAQLLEEDAVLFPKEVDRGLLVTIDPACECREEDLPGLKGVGHQRIVGIHGPR